MEQDPALVARTIEAVRSATSLDEALTAVVSQLRPRFDLWHASFSTYPTDAPVVRVLASWSLADTVFEAGTEVSATISKTVVTALETLRQGHGVSITVGADSTSLVDHLLREQGVASVLVLPVHRDERAMLLLALGAGSPDAFRDAEKGFFTGLSLGISDAVVRFASTATE